MKRLAVWSTCVLLWAIPGEAKPKIAERGGVRTPAGVEDKSNLAQGSVFEVIGEELGPAETALGEIPYPVALAGVSVKLASTAGNGVDAYIISASATRILAIVPPGAATGAYQATVTVGGEESNAFAVRIVERNFGLITNTGFAAGMVQGNRIIEGEDPRPVTFANSAAPGATIELDATGLGPVEGAGNDLPTEANLAAGAVMVIGEREIPVTYLGPNPARPGFDKLVVTLPEEELPSGCVVVFKVKNGETTSTSASIPILGPDETICKHPQGISPENLTILSEGGSIVRGGFTLVRLAGYTSAAGMTFEAKVEQFAGGFVRFTATDIAVMAANALAAGAYDSNRCVIHDAMEGPLGGVYVDAGDKMTLADPAWMVSIPRGTSPQGGLNQYNLVLDNKINGAPLPFQPAPPGLLFTPGKHTLTGPGGAVVGPFTVDLDVSPQFRWTNMEEIREIDSSRDMVLTFSGAGPDDVMNASGLVKGPAPENPSKTVDRIWVCLAKGSEGRVVVPASLLQKLPKVSAAQLADPRSGRYSSMSLASYNPTGAGEFRVPLTEGGTSELIAFIFSYTYSKTPVAVR